MSSENVFTFYENLKETLEKLGSQGGRGRFITYWSSSLKQFIYMSKTQKLLELKLFDRIDAQKIY